MADMKFLQASKEIQQLIEHSKIKFANKASALEDWLLAEKEIDYLPVLHSNSSINYQEQYYYELNDEIVDLSQVIYWDNRVVGILSLTLSQKDNNLHLTSQGGPVLQPLLKEEMPRSSQKKIYNECAYLINEIVKIYEINEFSLREVYTNRSSISPWYEYFLDNAYDSSNQFFLILNLEGGYDEIKKNYRKSYKSLINKGRKNWNVKIWEDDHSRWEEFRKLHQEVSGKVTRSKKTWEIQRDNLEDKNAIFIYILNNTDEIVGGAYFDLTKDEANYSVGVYRRDLSDQPLGHVVQDRAIQYFLDLGLKRYKIGHKPFQTLNSELSQKEKSISEFKSGFGAELVAEPQLKKMK